MSNLELSPIRCVVPASKKKKILEQLDQLGINEKFCFPEIDKVAHYLHQASNKYNIGTVVKYLKSFRLS